MHDDDVGRGQRHAGVDARQARIIPLRDFAEEDVGEDIGVSFTTCVTPCRL